MKKRLTRVSARCALRIGEEMLVHVGKHSKDNGKPAAWWFGGTVNGTPQNVAHLKKVLGATGFEGELKRRDDHICDLSCYLPEESWASFEEWLYEELPKLDIIGTATTEIHQEFKDEGVPLDLAQVVQYGHVKRHDVKGVLHTYLGKEVKKAMCYTHVVQCSVPRSAEEKIRASVNGSDNLYLITPADVGRGCLMGTMGGEPAKILVPEVLGLMFKYPTHATRLETERVA